METSSSVSDSKTRNALQTFSETSKKIGSTTAATIIDSSKKVGSGLSQIIKDFKSFLDRGNVIDVAVALVMGASFTALVNSFVSDLFSPLIGLIFSKSLSFTYLALKCPEGLEDQIAKGEAMDSILKQTKGAPLLVPCRDRGIIQRFFATPDLANKAGVLTWNYGNFVDKCITLLLTGAILFFIVKAYAAAFRRTQPKPKEKDCVYCFTSIAIRASRCPNCTSELEEYISDDETDDEKSTFLNFPIPFKRKSQGEKMVEVIDEMKRFFSQPALRDFITLKNSAKPHLLLRNALALSHTHKIIEFYEQSSPMDVKDLSDHELFGVLKAYLTSYEKNSVAAAQDLISKLENRNYKDGCNLEIQKLIIRSENGIEDVVRHFREKLGSIPMENRAGFYAGFLDIICGTFHRLEAGLNILESMVEQQILPTPDIILILLKNTTVLGDVETAMRLIKRVESGEFGFELDKKIVIQAAKTIAMEGDITHVGYMLDYLKVQNWKDDVESWAARMMAHEKSGFLDGAIKLYEHLRRKNIPPNHEILEILMRCYANDNNMSGVIRTYGLAGIMAMKQSLEMHRILIEAHLKVKEDVVAWNRCFHAIYAINRNKDHESWNIPSKLLLPIAQNAQGKHFAFALERLYLSELPRALYSKFITTLISHLVSKDAQDPHLAINLSQTLLPGGQFEDLESSESQLSGLICMAKIQKNELNEAMEIFDKNLKTWSTNHKYKVFSELVKAHFRNRQVKNALTVYSEAQSAGYISSPLMESLLENSEQLDATILQNLGQVAIDSGCLPCPKNEPLLFKRMNAMNAYGKF